MLLTLRDIWAAPPGVAEAAVRGVSLEVAAGEWVALGGPNGCGKSTLLLVAAGLLAPRQGTRELALEDGGAGRPDAAPRAVRVATILQDPSVQLLAPTVGEEIGLTAMHLGFAAPRIAAAVQRWSGVLGLDRELGREPRTLSAGQQQQVLIAAALACEPDLLVADEPGAHLDLEGRARVLEAIHRECARGLGVLWATQEPAERAAARRAIELAGVSRSEPSPAPFLAEGRAEGASPVLRIAIAPIAAGEGPRIKVETPLEICLPRAGVVAIAGPNGAGKSVLMAAACGLLDVPQIRLQRAGDSGPPLLVGQYPELQIFEETVEREVTFAAVSRGVSRPEALTRASDVLAGLGLAGLIAGGRRTWELSAGERRLVLLAGALIAPAGWLALDEPTAGLDSARRERLARLIAARASQTPILVASQDPDWVARLGVRAIRLGAG